MQCLIRWKISTSIKVKLEHFSLTLTIFEIFTFVAPFDGKYIASYLMAIVIYALFLAICEIIAQLIK